MDINRNILNMFLVKLFKVIVLLVIITIAIYLLKLTKVGNKTHNLIGYVFGTSNILIGTWKLLHSEPKTSRRVYATLCIVFGVIWTIESINGAYFPLETTFQVVVCVLVSVWLGLFVTLLLFVNYFNEEVVENEKNERKQIMTAFLSFFIFICLYTLYFLKV
jgi:hypothetical protein